MLDRAVLRWGGLSAMVGAVIGFVFNLLHPRSTEAAATLGGELKMVSSSDMWVFIHFMLAWSVAFSLVGLVAVGWSFSDGAAATWGRFAVASGIVGVAIGFATVLIDGPAVKHVADVWAEQHSPESLAAADAVYSVSSALFTGMIGSLFGLTPVLFGLATLNDAKYPDGLGYLSLGAGVLGLITGSFQYLTGISNLSANVMFPIASAAFIAWLFLMGLRLWRGAGGASPALESGA